MNYSIISLRIKGSTRFIHPKNELFLGIFHTTPIIDIHMILFGFDKNTLKVYEKKKNLFILHNFYIKNLSIFLAPPKKGIPCRKIRSGR